MSYRFQLSAHDRYTIPRLRNVFHISINNLEDFMASDENGTLVRTDINFRNITARPIGGSDEGYHAFTRNEKEIVAYRNVQMIAVERFQNAKQIFMHILTNEWTPLSIHSSHLNGDILVGMIKDGEAKVNRYSKTGRYIKGSIQKDLDGTTLIFSLPHYITEIKRNGYICVSDRSKEAIVVVDSNGHNKPEALYTGQGSRFVPFGICTDDRDHVLVCDGHEESIHLLDHECRFLCLLPTIQLGIEHPRSVCVDDQKYLWVGQQYTNTIKVYKII